MNLEEVRVNSSHPVAQSSSSCFSIFVTLAIVMALTIFVSRLTSLHI